MCVCVCVCMCVFKVIKGESLFTYHAGSLSFIMESAAFVLHHQCVLNKSAAVITFYCSSLADCSRSFCGSDENVDVTLWLKKEEI